MITLSVEMATIYNSIEQRLHGQREVILAIEMGAKIPNCAICGKSLAKEGRVWKEGDNEE